MGRLYILMGKSATGKDTLYQRLANDRELKLNRVVGYTTRPPREGEINGREYRFVDQDERKRIHESGRMIEERVYHTIFGDWYYFTADDGQIDLRTGDYLMIGTLEAYLSIQRRFGAVNVVPLYIEVEDGERLKRAIEREERTGTPKYAEMCRRYLADERDFSEERLKDAGIMRRYRNRSMEECLSELRARIRDGAPAEPEHPGDSGQTDKNYR